MRSGREGIQRESHFILLINCDLAVAKHPYLSYFMICNALIILLCRCMSSGWDDAVYGSEEPCCKCAWGGWAGNGPSLEITARDVLTCDCCVMVSGC